MPATSWLTWKSAVTRRSKNWSRSFASSASAASAPQRKRPSGKSARNIRRETDSACNLARRWVHLSDASEANLLLRRNIRKTWAGNVRKMKGFIASPMAQDAKDHPANIRQRMTERWAQRRLGKIEHE